jgi:hypothetical protein
MLQRIFSLIASLFFVALSSTGQAQSVMITEFMADNLTSTVRDSDGERNDWLELQNMTGATISLNGWYLTDNASDLRQWRFPVTAPVVNLAAGARLVVWCSGKNRKANAAQLHTNFKLDKDGEYLALVRPDGLTVEHSYGPKYPPQFINGTYGIALQYTTTTLVADTAQGKAHVPQSDADYTGPMAGWNSSANFDDSTWQSGQSGFGFGSPFTSFIGAGGDVSAVMQNINTSLCVRYKFDLPNPTAAAALRLRARYGDSVVCFLNGAKVGTGWFPPNPLAWNSFSQFGVPRPDSRRRHSIPIFRYRMRFRHW